MVSKTIYGDAEVKQVVDEEGDVGFQVVTTAGHPIGGVQWSREAAERDLAALHATFLRQQAEHAAKPKASGKDANAYFSGNESVVGAGPRAARRWASKR